MNATIALFLVQDGVINGALYALLALSLVLVFAVSRVVFIPQGEFVALGALTYATLADGGLPGSVWLLLGLGAAACLRSLASPAGRGASVRERLILLAATIGLPLAATGLAWLLAPLHPGALVSTLLTLAIVAPMAPYLYRLAFRPLANASVLVLLIAAVGVHLALVAFALLTFGADGLRAHGFSDASLALGPLTLTGQSLWIVGLTLALILGLWGFFEFTLTGKALRATSMNRLGARLVGIGSAQAGEIAFTLAGAIGAFSGVLMVPLTTIYYDSGFIIGLKGFTAAIIGGLVSYPVAAVAALFVGLLESFASFWASPFKEVIVFTAIIPVLLWRSLRSNVEADDE